MVHLIHKTYKLPKCSLEEKTFFVCVLKIALNNFREISLVEEHIWLEVKRDVGVICTKKERGSERNDSFLHFFFFLNKKKSVAKPKLMQDVKVNSGNKSKKKLEGLLE